MASERSQPEVFDYRGLRLSVGILALLLPFVLVVGALLTRRLPDGREMPPLGEWGLPSISAYYHSNMEGVFVGALWAIATFLFAYKGMSTKDTLASRLGCVFTLGVALFPTTDPVTGEGARWASFLHGLSAAGLFSILAVFCLYLFRGRLRGELTVKEARRKRIYTVCGWAILFCIVAIGGSALLAELTNSHDWRDDSKLVFYLEWLALAAFAVSWFTAGKWAFVGFLVDPKDAFRIRGGAAEEG